RPAARYYQRLLARDRCEAEAVVKEYLAGHPVEDLFDRVLVPALVLVRRGRKAGELRPEDEEFILRTTREIVDGMTPPAAAGAGPGGRGRPGRGAPPRGAAPLAPPRAPAAPRPRHGSTGRVNSPDARSFAGGSVGGGADPRPLRVSPVAARPPPDRTPARGM